jgi:MoaA/NifB/PqqE/SkfB family radical SAM enzyme
MEFLGQLKQIYFCGTYGDPLANRDLVEMCRFLKEGNPGIEIGIHTNGGIGNTQKYQKLAAYTDFIAFGIDGLEDTNHVYRRHVNFDKVIENSRAYIQAGGCAIWDFIVFKHNQHQVDQAREFALGMGFHEFNVKKTSRFLNRKHEFNDNLLVYNKNGFIDYAIALPDNRDHVNEQYQVLDTIRTEHSSIERYAMTTCVSCNSKRIKEIYIGADGFVFPCGWIHDRLYGPEVETHKDHFKLKEMIARAGGLTATNIFHATLEKIINRGWFDIIEQSWQTENRLERCGMMCGERVNLIRSQNKDIKYKK